MFSLDKFAAHVCTLSFLRGDSPGAQWRPLLSITVIIFLRGRNYEKQRFAPAPDSWSFTPRSLDTVMLLWACGSLMRRRGDTRRQEHMAGEYTAAGEHGGGDHGGATFHFRDARKQEGGKE